jgi:parallel beta-helix repeat protein
VAVVLTVTSHRQNADAGTGVAPASPFFVTRAGDTYHAESQSTSSYSGTLKAVVEAAVSELNKDGGGTITFSDGTFDLGSEYFKLEDVHEITFQGQGIGVTTIQNSSDAAADTEPFNFSGAFGITIRDMTVLAGGTVRLTSDALDFDEGNDSLVERVEIRASRGRAIVFDGKNAGWESRRNVVRDCIVDGTPAPPATTVTIANSGVEFLASSDNLIEGCTIKKTGRHGIEAAKSSAAADQPNKKANNNVIRNNVVEDAGIDGINVTNGDGNRIEGNVVTNSSDAVPAADGIRITSADAAVTCDDNVVEDNRATDTQAVKTQRYGLNIASPLCNRTIVGGANDFTGNLGGSVNDLGTATVYPPDTRAPTTPGSLGATAVYREQIDLRWVASVDSVGVTAYEIWRDGALLATIEAQTSYADTSVAPGSSHTYQVRARDSAGNLSPFSNTASATTPSRGLLFQEDFETGDLSKWTSSSNFDVQQQDVYHGSWGGRSTGANTGAFAIRQFPYSEGNLYALMHFKVISQSTNLNLLRFRAGIHYASVLGIFVNSAGKLAYRNDVSGASTTSTTTVTQGTWHTVQVHISINGAAGQTEVWIDGTRVNALSNTESLGTNPIRRLELGTSATNQTYDVVFDDVGYDRDFIPLFPDITPPSAPANLRTTSVSGTAVELAWNAATDNVAVSSYRLRRDGAAIADVSAATLTYTDSGLTTGTLYRYTLTALDAQGNESPPSNELQVTPSVPRPDAPSALSALAAAGADRVDLSWSAPANSAGVVGYRIYRDGASTPLASVSGVATTTYQDTSVAPATAYSYTVTALDGAGTESEPSAAANVTTSDTLAPSAPSDLVATAGQGEVRVDLSWTAATDNVGVTNYRITRNGAVVATIGAVTGYVDRDVTAFTQYEYSIEALDAAGNVSPASNTAAVLTSGPPTLACWPFAGPSPLRGVKRCR